MDASIDLPEWDDIDWETFLKNNMSENFSSPTLKSISKEVTVTSEKESEWVDKKLKAFASQNQNYSSLDQYLNQKKYSDKQVSSSSNESSSSGYGTKKSPVSNKYEEKYFSSDSSRKENQRPISRGIPQENLIKTLVLEFRSLFLSSSEQLKILRNFLTAVKDHMNQEADLDQKAIRQLVAVSFPSNPPNFQIPFQKLHQRYPHLISMEEIQLFDEGYQLLRQGILETTEQLSHCFNMKKMNYLQQLRRLKEASNTAIRNAIQAEKAEALQNLHRLKALYEQQYQTEKKKLDEINQRILQEKQVIEEDYLRVKMHLEEVLEKEKISSQRQQDAIKQALKEQKGEHQQEFIHLRERMVQDLQRYKEESQHQYMLLKQSQEMAFQELKTSEREKRELLEKAKHSLEQESSILRKENAEYSAQLSSTRDQFRRQMEEIRDKHARDLQERAANDLQSQAMIKNELTTVMQRVQKEEQRRRQELEDQFTKMRNDLITAQTLEMEKLQERHRSEIKRIQTEAETRNQENLFKLKQQHEQELNRQIRENDRLQRLLARQGVATAVMAEAGNFAAAREISRVTSPEPNWTRPSEPATMLTPPSKFQQRQKEIYKSDADPIPMKPFPATTTTNGNPEQTSKYETAAARISSEINRDSEKTTSSSGLPPPLGNKKLNWGFLEHSLKAQEDRDIPRFSKDHLPPDPFQLNEAMEATKKYQDGIGISSNAVRVTNYLHELENYLHGKPPSVDREVKELSADDLERRNYLRASVRASNHLLHPDQSDKEEADEDSLDNESIDLQKLAQLPLEVSGNPSSTSFTSSSDGVFDHLHNVSGNTHETDYNLSQLLSRR